MEPYLIEVPFAYLASTRRPRARKWGHTWITETTTVAIERLDSSALRVAARIVDKATGLSEDVLHAGRGFVARMRPPVPGIDVDEAVFADLASGRTTIPEGRFPDWPFRVIPVPRMVERCRELDVFVNGKGLAAAGVEEVAPGDRAREVALEHCARAAAGLMSVDGRILRRVAQPTILADMSADRYGEGEFRGSVGRLRSEDRDRLNLPLTAASHPDFETTFFVGTQLSHEIEIVSSAPFAGFDLVRSNAACLASTIQKALPTSIAHCEDPRSLLDMSDVLRVAADLRAIRRDPNPVGDEVLGRLVSLADREIVPAWIGRTAAWMASTRDPSRTMVPTVDQEASAFSVPI